MKRVADGLAVRLPLPPQFLTLGFTQPPGDLRLDTQRLQLLVLYGEHDIGNRENGAPFPLEFTELFSYGLSLGWGGGGNQYSG